MWQKDDIEWADNNKKNDYKNGTNKGPHGDYFHNLRVAAQFIEKTRSSWTSGMNISIENSHGLDKSLLMISWMPPRHAKVGNWANPIFLHQEKSMFEKAMFRGFNDYMRRIESFEKSVADI
jgi:hypothetical protein